ncbi:ornithine decarboxylase-like [Amphiura filiformis]|uniref:ornithine decarboxylase-like n=1 Tax=Amphiura filiformis TaxID=82378 RepID=UPI003B20EB30
MAQHTIRDFMPYAYDRGVSKRDFIEERVHEKCDRKFEEDAFMVVDIGDVLKKHKEWLSELPRVTPFFAVKCMPYNPVLILLSSLGCGFDCASLEEIERVLSLGVSPSRIVYSHTQKQMSYISYAAKNNVDLMTFDSEEELLKIKKVFPAARLLLRLSIFDQTAQNPFGFKYGCHHKNVKTMLEMAKKHELQLVGCHFHIGSGSSNPAMFENTLQFAKKVFDVGNRMGFNMNVLDIGGGFPGSPRCANPFRLFAWSIREGIENYFPPDSGVTIIAEPGRFYAESAVTLAANVIGIKTGPRIGHSVVGSSNRSGRRSRKRPILTRQPSTIQRRLSRHESISHFAEMSGIPALDKPLTYDYMYFVNDGLFSSFLRNVFGFPVLPPRALKDAEDDEMEYECMVMGETCPEEDVIVDECMLPKLDVGDWMVFEDMGAYTCMTTGFNGFKKRFFYYAVPENVWYYVQPLLARCTAYKDAIETNNNPAVDAEDQRDISATDILQDVYSLQEF